MLYILFAGLLLPFVGTILGSSAVFYMKKKPAHRFMASADSFAAGIMCAAAFFSLILPALEKSSDGSLIYRFSCVTGFMSGIIIFALFEKILRKIYDGGELSGNMLMWAVSAHNIPEGMAVGVTLSGLIPQYDSAAAAAALTLSFGIAVQNIPEGMIISVPSAFRGKSRKSAFVSGIISGIVELLSGLLTLFISSFVSGILPFSLCLAASAMFYVVLSQLSENFSDSRHGEKYLIIFGIGFSVMMLLDTFLG